MRDARGCPVCGEDDCVRHGGVVTFARLLTACALVALALLTGLIAAGWAIVRT